MKCEEIDSLQGLIMRMTHLYYGKAYAAMKELDVHPRQIPLLFILQKKEGMSQREICDEMKIKPPTVAFFEANDSKYGTGRKQKGVTRRLC